MLAYAKKGLPTYGPRFGKFSTLQKNKCPERIFALKNVSYQKSDKITRLYLFKKMEFIYKKT
jgi:hypothetical protein